MASSFFLFLSGMVMIDYVLWNSNWQDPGAQASGSPYGSPMNLTSSILIIGALAVDTSLATPSPYPPNSPGYVVTYSLNDPVTNKPYSAKRYIYVICSPSEKMCVDPATSTNICTTNGACINVKFGLALQGDNPCHFSICFHTLTLTLLPHSRHQLRLPPPCPHPPGSHDCLH